MKTVMSSAITESFFPFLIHAHFVSFSCLIVLSMISNIMSNTSRKSGRPCFASHRGSKTFSLPLSSIMLAVGYL